MSKIAKKTAAPKKSSTKSVPKKLAAAKATPASTKKRGTKAAAEAALEAAKELVEKPARAADLPPVGTRLEKRDRAGLLVAACTVVADGVEMDGKTYPSLTAATRALGKGGSGPKFWGLVAGPARTKDHAGAIAKAFGRYVELARSAIAADVTHRDAVQEHARQLGAVLAE